MLLPLRPQDMKWFKEEFTPTVATRGGALIKKWGRSSAASTAVSIADAIRSLVVPTAPGDCFSTAVITDGNPYGIQEGLVFSMPCRCVRGCCVCGRAACGVRGQAAAAGGAWQQAALVLSPQTVLCCLRHVHERGLLPSCQALHLTHWCVRSYPMSLACASTDAACCLCACPA